MNGQGLMRRNVITSAAELLTMLVAAAGLVLLPQASSAGGAKGKPADVVKEYCRLDSQGARLSSANWPRVAPLVSWEEEPGWETATIISRYRIQSTTVRPDHAIVIVVFRIIGQLEDDKPFASKRKYETLAFRLERAGDSWKIVRPVAPPHVSARAMMEHLRGLIEREKAGSERREELEGQLRHLAEVKK